MIFGHTDSRKLRSSLTLFDAVAPDGMFAEGLRTYFNGERDQHTITYLQAFPDPAVTAGAAPTPPGTRRAFGISSDRALPAVGGAIASERRGDRWSDMVFSYVRDLLEGLTGTRPEPNSDGDLLVGLGGAQFYVRVVNPDDAIVQVFSVRIADLGADAGADDSTQRHQPADRVRPRVPRPGRS